MGMGMDMDVHYWRFLLASPGPFLGNSSLEGILAFAILGSPGSKMLGATLVTP